MIERLLQSGRSFMRLPLWVRLWLALGLAPVNAAAFLLGDTPTGRRVSVATAFVLLTNGPIIMIQRGWGKLLAVPHLIAWIPLLISLVKRLGEPGLSRRERIYAAFVLTFNGLSLIFDAIDAWRWIKGEREVP